MASTGINNGTISALYVYVAGVATKIADMTTNDFSVEMATRDASNKDSGGWQDILEGQKSWSMSADAYFSEDASYGYEDLFDLWTGRTKVLVAFSSSVNGDK